MGNIPTNVKGFLKNRLTVTYVVCFVIPVWFPSRFTAILWVLLEPV